MSLPMFGGAVFPPEPGETQLRVAGQQEPDPEPAPARQPLFAPGVGQALLSIVIVVLGFAGVITCATVLWGAAIAGLIGSIGAIGIGIIIGFDR